MNMRGKLEESEHLRNGRETVLLVEEDPLARELAALVLGMWGYGVLEAANGVEALRVAHEHAWEEIHLLLTPVDMSVMRIKDLPDKIRAMWPNVQALLISEQMDDPPAHFGVPDPGIEFMGKRALLAKLPRKVREVLDKGRVTSPKGRSPYGIPPGHRRENLLTELIQQPTYSHTRRPQTDFKDPREGHHGAGGAYRK